MPRKGRFVHVPGLANTVYFFPPFIVMYRQKDGRWKLCFFQLMLNGAKKNHSLSEIPRQKDSWSSQHGWDLTQINRALGTETSGMFKKNKFCMLSQAHCASLKCAVVHRISSS